MVEGYALADIQDTDINDGGARIAGGWRFNARPAG